jgi:hypothetical protein
VLGGGGRFMEREVESLRREIGVHKKCRIRSVTMRPNYFNSEGNETCLLGEQGALGHVFFFC